MGALLLEITGYKTGPKWEVGEPGVEQGPSAVSSGIEIARFETTFSLSALPGELIKPSGHHAFPFIETLCNQ